MTRVRLNRAAEQRAQYERDRDAGKYSGSRKQITWNEVQSMHDCCGSKKAIYHKAECPRNGKRIPRIDDKGPDVDQFTKKVRELKEQGMTSGEIFEQLQQKDESVTLARVNKAYV